MTRAHLGVCLGLVCLPALGGCLFAHHSTRLVREHEAQRPVAFETELAQQVFESRALNDEARQEAGTGHVVAIPFLVWWSSTKTLSPTAWYNDAARACDSNRDATITESEALAYNPTFASDAASEETVELEPEPSDRNVKPVEHTTLDTSTARAADAR